MAFSAFPNQWKFQSEATPDLPSHIYPDKIRARLSDVA
jgi:hypothetical protein